MKKVFRILLIVLLAGLFVGTFVFLWNKTRPVKTVYGIVTPVRDTISQFVVATGQVEPRDEVLIKPQISGIISALHKEAGNMVRQGDVIATVKVIPEMSSLKQRRIGSQAGGNKSGTDQARIRTHRKTLPEERHHPRRVREGGDTAPDCGREPPERTRQPGNRTRRHRLPQRRNKQYPDTFHDRRHDTGHSRQGGQLGHPVQYVQRRHDNSRRGRHETT